MMKDILPDYHGRSMNNSNDVMAATNGSRVMNQIFENEAFFAKKDAENINNL